MGDASGASVGAVAHLTEASFPFPKIWSLYPAILGQAIPSAFGRFRLAITDYIYLDLNTVNHKNIAWASLYFSESSDFSSYFVYDLTQKIVSGEKLVLNLNHFTVSQGNPIWKNINNIRIAFQSKEECSFSMTPLSLSTYQAMPMCTLWFDDGWKDNYNNAYPIMRSINPGFKAEVSIIGQYIGLNQYMNEPELKHLLQSGWGLSNHTFSHKYLSEIPLSQAREEIFHGINHLYPISKTDALNLAVPYSSVNKEVLAIIEKNTLSCRYVPEQYNSIPADRFKIAYFEVKNSTDFNTVKHWIDTSIVNNYWLVLLFHKVETPSAEPTMISENQFRKIIEYLNEKKQDIKVMNASEALNSMGYDLDH